MHAAGKTQFGGRRIAANSIRIFGNLYAGVLGILYEDPAVRDSVLAKRFSSGQILGPALTCGPGYRGTVGVLRSDR